VIDRLQAASRLLDAFSGYEHKKAGEVVRRRGTIDYRCTGAEQRQDRVPLIGTGSECDKHLLAFEGTASAALPSAINGPSLAVGTIVEANARMPWLGMASTLL
jgi:hypothetical protein